MKTPESLESLVEYGIIQEVLRPLMSGKEAQIYVVLADGEECVAKVYKEATQRTFKHRSEYTEGRRMRNSRDQRAVNKRTQHGRKQDEAAWRNAEVEMISRARRAGVRVPEAINFVDGVLVMELVKDADGDPAPRLGDLTFSPSEASEIYQGLIRDTVRMLCAGVIHGDLSDFNVLMGADGPVFIDFPQAVDPASNQNARKLLTRDVDNLHRFLERHRPEHVRRPYAQEMWSLYEANRLEPDTTLGGNFRAPEGKANTDEVLALIEDANAEERERRDERGEDRPLVARRPQRVVVDFTNGAGPAPKKRAAARGGRAADTKRAKPASLKPSAADDAAPKKRRNRRRRKPNAAAEANNPAPQPARNRDQGEKSVAEAPGAEATKRRRRGRGGRSRSKAATTSTDSGSATNRTSGSRRPARPRPDRDGEKGSVGGSKSGQPSHGEDRPARRRRRRPRSPGPRDST